MQKFYAHQKIMWKWNLVSLGRGSNRTKQYPFSSWTCNTCTSGSHPVSNQIILVSSLHVSNYMILVNKVAAQNFQPWDSCWIHWNCHWPMPRYWKSHHADPSVLSLSTQLSHQLSQNYSHACVSELRNLKQTVCLN
jgi:hypothetical protein